MEVEGKRVLVLGAYGEVGMAVCRILLTRRPEELIITSLHREEADRAAVALMHDAPSSCRITPFHGNLFVRWDLKDIPNATIATTRELRRRVVDDNLKELTPDILEASTLYRLITTHAPDCIIDCVTTATALAYQNIYHSFDEVCGAEGTSGPEGAEESVYRILSAVSLPPLIRHIQILHEAMKKAGTRVYIKVGTTGTGGMGFNIPFTHGEESPSRLLMAKTAVAGAHTMLLFVLNRMPGWPAVKEIKPAAMIGWRAIGNGPIARGGNAFPLYDCPPEKAVPLVSGSPFSLGGAGGAGPENPSLLEGTYVDTGENGVFSLHEFKTITALGLMEFLTPEEIARSVLENIEGRGSSKDVISALDGAVMGPTYRAGFLRDEVVKGMEDRGAKGTSYGFLGPRLSKLLFEAQTLALLCRTMERTQGMTPEALSQGAEHLVFSNREFRSNALSIGIPILLPDGRRLLCAERRVKDKDWEKGEWIVDDGIIEKWASREWIDLRPANMKTWQDRVHRILQGSSASGGDSSSRHDRGTMFWRRDGEGETILDAGETAAWVLINDFGGGREGDNFP